MKIDFIDVLSNAVETVFGRIFLTSVAIILPGAVALLIGIFEDIGIVEALAFVVPVLLFSVLDGVGLIVLPVLFGFTLCFVRFEWSYIWLLFPAGVSFLTSLHLAA